MLEQQYPDWRTIKRKYKTTADSIMNRGTKALKNE